MKKKHNPFCSWVLSGKERACDCSLALAHEPILICGCWTNGKKNQVIQCPLHASAPELLQKLKDLIFQVKGQVYPYPDMKLAVTKAEAIIAKASGK